MKTLLTLIAFLSVSLCGYAQQGTLTGKVKDKLSGEPIIGATVAVVGTSTGASTDFNGDYSIPLNAGTYKVTISYVSYKSNTQENVSIKAGQTTTLDVNLETSATELNAVTITGARQTNTDISLISEIKKSNIVVSGMSAEQIVKAQDRDAAEVVKRIPGITIMDNRFIVVRGLSERYNSVMLNEALAPSSEIDVRAFSFDILPTSVIDRVLIYKSPAPELPGDFAGGAIKVYTKNVVNNNATFFGISSSYRGNTTFNSFNTYEGGKTDWLGFDDGTRKLPGNFPSINEFQNNLTNQQKSQYGKQVPNIWNINSIKAAPDLRLNFGLNRLFTIAGKDFSSISAITYSNTRQNIFADRKNLNDYTVGQEKEINWDFKDQISSQGVRIGLLQNFGLRLNNRSKIEFRNLFNQIGLAETTVREGYRQDFGTQEERNYLLSYESRSIFTSQLQGTHTSENEKNIITWTAGANYISRDQPDMRRVRTVRETGSEGPYDVIIPFNNPSLSNSGRFYSNLTEKGVTAAGQLEHVFGNPDSANIESNLRLKVGFFTEAKDRKFESRYFGYIFPFGSTANRQAITLAPLEQVFAPENLNAETGMIFEESTRPNDRYTASNTLGAGYVSLAKTINKITLYGGARAEYNLRKLTAVDYTGDASVNDPTFYVLPSLNVAYNFTDRTLLRLAYGMTVNRPEFREQARFSYFDFVEYASYEGNNNLKTATIHNLDMRYEFYPRPSESISLGAFYKKFLNPIEVVIRSGGADPVYSFSNAQQSTALGLEAEVKKSFLEISESRFIQNHSLTLNASVIHSRVQFNEETDQGQDNNRALQGQSPYIVNAGLYYQDDDSGWQYSLLYNVLGKRIYRVGSVNSNPTLYEMPRNVVDFSVTKNLKNGLQLKAGVQDVFNQSFRFIQDTDRNGKLTSFDDTVRNFQRGSYSTLSLNYNF